MENIETQKVPCLYVIVDTDMTSMTNGKSQAHSGHASSAFSEKAFVVPLLAKEKPDPLAMQWRTETDQGFGTQINLKAKTSQLKLIVEMATMLGFQSEEVFDPTYPYHVDSEIVPLMDPTVHTLPPIPLGDQTICFRREMTAVYVFGDKNDPVLSALLRKFPLHP